ncbi:MAG: secretion system protein, partial [Solirubrobacteraceae bacterium]
MTAMALAGALVGVGIWGLVRALHPQRPSLAQALASLRPVTSATAIVTPIEATWGPIARLGTPILRILEGNVGSPATLLSAGVHRDLIVVQRSAQRHLAEKLATALIGFLTPTLAASVLAAAGATMPLALPLALAVGLAVAGFFLPDGAVRSEAER